MGWAAIIGAIISALLPYFLEWLESIFNKVAPTLPEPDTFATPEEGVDALFGAAMQEAHGFFNRLKVRWAWRVARRNAADVMAARPFTLNQEEAEEGHEFASIG